MSQLHVYEIYSGGSDYVVAESEGEAIVLLAEWASIEVDDLADSECTLWPDDKHFTIGNAYDNEIEVTKTCAEWAAENGKGFLASTEY